MNPAALVVERFGSLRKLASALGHLHHTTVQGWLASGRVPSRQQTAVLDAAIKLGISLTPEELVRGSNVRDGADGTRPGQNDTSIHDGTPRSPESERTNNASGSVWHKPHNEESVNFLTEGLGVRHCSICDLTEDRPEVRACVAVDCGLTERRAA